MQRADRVGPQAQIGQRLLGALGHRIHHARLGQHVNQLGQAGRRLNQCPIAQRRHDGPLDDRIDQQPMGGAFDRRAIEIALDQISAGTGQLQIGHDVELRGLRGDGVRRAIGLAGQRINVNFPQHRAPVSLRPKVFPNRRLRDRLIADRKAANFFSNSSIAASTFAIGQQDLLPQRRVAGGDPRRVEPAAGGQAECRPAASTAARAAAMTCGAWLIAANARSCIGGRHLDHPGTQRGPEFG